MSNWHPIRVLIADDHPLIRTAIKSVINSQMSMEVVGEAGNGEDAVNLYREQTPDVTLMDLSMPKMNGLEAMQLILDHNPAARIIVLTNSDSDEDIYHGINAGAMGYLLKDTPQEKLVNTIRAVFAGQKQIPKGMEEKLKQRKMHPKLSPREMEVIELIKAGNNNKMIAFQLGITESTVKSHVNSILIKLGVNDRTQAVTTALQRGLIHQDQ